MIETNCRKILGIPRWQAFKSLRISHSKTSLQNLREAIPGNYHATCIQHSPNLTFENKLRKL